MTSHVNMTETSYGLLEVIYRAEHVFEYRVCNSTQIWLRKLDIGQKFTKKDNGLWTLVLQTHVKSQLEGQGQEYRSAFEDGREKTAVLQKNIARQKMAYAGHVLRGSSGLNALLIMESKISGVKARGRPRRAWTDDLKDWTQLRNYSELKRTAKDRTIWNALARQPST